MKVELAENRDGKFYVFDGDYIGKKLLAGERWEPWVLDCIAGVSDRRKVFIDVGAFIGTHTVFAAHRYQHVHAFEPYPAFAEILRRNIELNELTNVTVHEVALGNDDGRTVRMHDFGQVAEIDEDTNFGGLSRVVRGATTGVRVPQKTLDGFRFKNIAAIKIDTQGTEYRVLQGGNNTIRKQKPFIFLEGVNRQLDEQGDSFTDIRQFFRDRNYNLNRIRRNVGDFMGVPKR